ncbi:MULTISPECIES: hypothetical protein [Flavobacteriaceae]|uniref:Uncharacterized protein n=2 Tax=Flavobacteriaceae TaxID=49546 RepID=A0A4Y8ASY3_9FLAO|nr:MULTISPECIES: hypothetical protein [Flavobacteriaceae]TEW75001.1 hypothetical protein E2488_05600 [Gramella jeungdoensis]GGK42426.1 hypothetical protein GCM10007963_08050 [Lutibacter litoralis]
MNSLLSEKQRNDVLYMMAELIADEKDAILAVNKIELDSCFGDKLSISIGKLHHKGSKGFKYLVKNKWYVFGDGEIR